LIDFNCIIPAKSRLAGGNPSTAAGLPNEFGNRNVAGSKRGIDKSDGMEIRVRCPRFSVSAGFFSEINWEHAAIVFFRTKDDIVIHRPRDLGGTGE